MRYAVISDIHGNYHALTAVLADAKQQGASSFIFLGDYYLDMPFPNEVAEAVKSLKNAYVIKGNKEDYFREVEPDRSKWEREQYSPLYWNYDELSPENLSFLSGLPAEISFTGADGEFIRMNHAAEAVFAGTSAVSFRSGAFYRKMKEKPFSHEEYLQFAENTLAADAELGERLENLPDGAYLFGHTHIQWHAHLNGKLLMNPGSCGVPLDFDNRAAYSILEFKNGCFSVLERRVVYDADEAVLALKSSGLYRAAWIWSEVTLEHLRYGEERISFLMDIAKKLADEAGGFAPPYPNEIWRRAYQIWRRLEF